MKMFLALLAMCLGMAHVYASTQSTPRPTIELPDDIDIEDEDEAEGDE